MNKTEQVFDECLQEMFDRVSEKTPPYEFAKQGNWYQLHCWTEKEQDDFREWMGNHLKKRMKWNKNTISKEVGYFILNYGWTTNKEQSESRRKENH